MSVLLYFLAAVGVLSLIVFSVDLYISLNKWQSRIHIGRWVSFIEWKGAVDKCSKRWLVHSPTVPMYDTNRYIILDILRGNYRNSTIQSWQDAGLYMGVCSKVSHSQRLQIIDRLGKQSIFNIDFALSLYALIAYSPGDLEDKGMHMADRFYSLVKEIQGFEKTVPYRKHLPERRFVDTVGMICPFLFMYSGLTGNRDASELALRQIKEYEKYLHPVIGFPPHSVDVRTGAPSGVYDWGRGVGWFILGLVESRRAILANHEDCSNEYIDYIEKMILKLAIPMTKYQLPNGGFSFFVCDRSSFGEGSASVLAGLLFFEAYLISEDEKYKKITDRVLSFLMTITQRNGAIDMCQGDTKGVGIYSMRFGYMPFAQGLLSLLLNRYVDKDC